MPKTFSESEKNAIKTQLITKGTEIFGKLGIRKTSIDELIDGIGIAKGSFYKFYPSKEALFVDVFLQNSNELAEQLPRILEQPGKSSRAIFKEYLQFHFDTAATNPIIRLILKPDEMAQLVRKVPMTDLVAVWQFTQNVMRPVLVQWQEAGVLRPIDPDLLIALFQSCFMVSNQNDSMGPMYPAVIHLLVDILAEYCIVEQG